MKKHITFTRSLCLLLAAAGIVTGCSSYASPKSPSVKDEEPLKKESLKAALDFQVTPETFTLSLQNESETIPVSGAGEAKTVKDFEKTGEETKWQYPNEEISVSIKPEKDYLSVSITADAKSDQAFTWPHISSESYYLPLGEGKRIPAQDQVWKDYLKDQEFSVLEQLSMPFFASEYGNHAILFIMEQPFRTSLSFESDPGISFSVKHEYPQIGETRTNKFRIYLTANDPVSIAKIYKSYVTETQGFKTLEEKAGENPEIKKLYGAPFIYLWGDFIVSPEDIYWPAFRNAVNSPVMDYVLTFVNSSENGTEFSQTLDDIKTQDYVAQYQKNVICRYFSELLKREDFYNPALLTKTGQELDSLLSPGYEKLTPSEKIQVNSYALYENLPGVLKEVETWMNKDTLDLISDMKKRGVDQAWIGLNSWEQAYAKPKLVEQAVSEGYLIGSYDSYHSIHQPGREQWITAKFDDASLYENATVTDKNGEKIGGFQNVGRKLNPALSLPAVKDRMSKIMENKLPFNSWFIDCDATGEIYDDYTSAHMTSQEGDLKARLERMSYIRDTYNMVIGSEGGHDFAASDIAFAHGIELKSFSWMDPDMKENKDSQYYIGKYYNPAGGVAEHFAKRIPIKDNYYTLFVDPRYDVPLFRLVYNDSVITSYHWDWSTFKIKGATKDRMVREVLYNVPPLYHLDGTEWETCKEDITNHTKVWSQFSKQAILQEMTGFEYVEEDGSVQMTEYGGEIKVVANFNDSSYSYNSREIPGHSAMLETKDGTFVYTPSVSPDNS